MPVIDHFQSALFIMHTLASRSIFHFLILSIFTITKCKANGNDDNGNIILIPEKGTSGSCSSLTEFLNSRNNSDFTNVENYPLSNYKIKYKEKGKNLGGKHWKTRGWVSCQRVPVRHALREDRAAYIYGYKKLTKSDRRGRFMCINGQWSARWRNPNGKWGIMTCPNYKIKKEWANMYLPKIQKNNFLGTTILQKNWQVTFSLYLFNKTAGWSNLIHLSDIGMHQRHPAVYFRDNSYNLYIVGSKGCHNKTEWIQNNSNYETGWEDGEFHDLKLTSVREENTENDENVDLSRVKLYVDGILVKEWMWENLCYGIEANMYSANPWTWKMADVSLLNFEYSSL